jgi:allantoinase
MNGSHSFDKIIKNVRLVRPSQEEIERVDLGIKGGKFVRVEPDLDVGDAAEVIAAAGLLAFPGLVDAHMHIGIYQELSKDAVSESRAAAMGGVTSSINYIRTGQYYLFMSIMPIMWRR